MRNAQATWRDVDDRLADLVVTTILKIINEAPSRELTEVGFDWALYIALKRRWPDVGMRESVRWLREYIGVQYGTPGYDWTASAAESVAAEFTSQFGEAA